MNLRGDSKWVTGLGLFIIGGDVAVEQWDGAFMMGAVLCILRGAQGIFDAMVRESAELDRLLAAYPPGCTCIPNALAPNSRCPHHGGD